MKAISFLQDALAQEDAKHKASYVHMPPVDFDSLPCSIKQLLSPHPAVNCNNPETIPDDWYAYKFESHPGRLAPEHNWFPNGYMNEHDQGIKSESESKAQMEPTHRTWQDIRSNELHDFDKEMKAFNQANDYQSSIPRSIMGTVKPIPNAAWGVR